MSKCKLGDYCLRITDGEHGTVIDDVNGDYYLLSNKNIVDNKIVITEFDRKINEETYEKIDKRTKLAKNDVLISTVGTIGKTIVLSEKPNFVVQRSVGIIKPNTNLLNPYYLKYKLDTPYYQKILDFISKGAVQKCIFIFDLANLDFDAPSINYQNKIVNILKLLDDKIENNNKINEKLETIAKTIYDYWFLQFEFPNEEGKPYKSSGGKMVWNEELKREIPEGWEVKKLKEIESNIITGKTPSTKNLNYYNGDIPFITIGDIRNNMHIICTEQNLSKEGAEIQKNKYIPKGAICVSCIATPGLVGFSTKISQTNQQINSVVCRKEYNKLFLYFAIKDFFKFSSGAKTGNTFANMNKEDFSNISILYPNEKKLIDFYKKINCVNELILKNSIENQELTSLRDFLLPLLMNGQVEFKEVALAEE